MNRSETAILLATVTSLDRRTLGDDDVQAWHAVLADVALPDATAAVVNHHRESTDWLTPAHVVAGVRRVRRERLPRECPDPIPPCDPDDVDTYRRQLLAQRQRVMGGTADAPRAILPAQNPEGDTGIPNEPTSGTAAELDGRKAAAANAREVLAEVRRRLAVQRAAEAEAERSAAAKAREMAKEMRDKEAVETSDNAPDNDAEDDVENDSGWSAETPPDDSENGWMSSDD